MTIKISQLPPGALPTDPDVFPTVQGLNTVKVTWAQIVESMASAVNLILIDPSRYTNIPVGDGLINFNDTTGLEPGQPLVVTQAALAKHYIITAVVPGTSISIAGPQLTPAVAIDSIARANVGNTVQADLLLPGNYEFGGTTPDLLDRATRSPFFWHLPKAYLCYAQFSHDTIDSGTQPEVNVSLRGNNVFANPVILSGVANTPTGVADGSASVSEYVVNWGDKIEIALTAAAGNLDAKDLTAALTFKFA